jgi:hypothetical protein
MSTKKDTDYKKQQEFVSKDISSCLQDIKKENNKIKMQNFPEKLGMTIHEHKTNTNNNPTNQGQENPREQHLNI